MKISVIAFIDDKDGWKPTLTSVTEQTYEDLELLLIDAGESADKGEWVKAFARTDQRVKICGGIYDKGTSTPRDITPTDIEGQYVMELSAGMMLAPDAVERMMHVFARRKNEVFIYTDVLPVDRNNEVLEVIAGLTGEMENFYLYNPLRLCFVCKKEVYEAAGGWTERNLWLRMQEEGFPMYRLRAKMCRLLADRELSGIGSGDDILGLRIRKYEEDVKGCQSLERNVKTLEELIRQCRKYKRNGSALRLAADLMLLHNPVKEYRARSQRIKDQSRAAFNRLADSYEQDGGYEEPRKCYGPVMKIIRKYAGKDLKLLDIGCGPGIMLQMALDAFPDAMRIDGIDLSPAMVRQANTRLTDDRAAVMEGTIDTAAIPEGFYDIELCMHSFHHYPKPLTSLCCMNRAMRGNGVLIIADNYYKGFKRLEQNFDLYVSRYAYGDMWMYSAWELTVLTAVAGFHRQRFYKVGEKSFLFICQKRN